MQQTSLLSYNKLRMEDLGERQKLVYDAFRMYGDHTDLEMVKLIGLSDCNMLRPRRNELVRYGLIEEKKKRKCKISNRLSIVWGTK